MAAPKSQLLTGLGKPFEVLRSLVNAVLNEGGSDEDVERLLSPDKVLAREVARVIMSRTVENTLPNLTFAIWQMVYEQMDGIDDVARGLLGLDLTPRPGLWVIPVLQGVAPNKVVAALRRLKVNVWSYIDDLDALVNENDRDPKDGSYVIYCRQTIEADEQFKSLSVNELKTQGIKGLTLTERLLIEPAYFLATDGHLDVQNLTLCSGSRRPDGRVPSVSWDLDDRRVYVSVWSPSDRRVNLCCREAIS